MCSTFSRSTPTTKSRRSSCSTSTTLTPPSGSSTPDTSPAKRPPTRTHGLPSRALTPRSTGTNSRRGRTFAPGDLIPYIRATWDVAPQASIYIEAVHRLTNLGAVVTNAVNGTSQEGFDAEWREVSLLTFDGDRINRCELFDE